MFKRFFSSSPSRPPPPDPTPKWKDEVSKIESNTTSLKAVFPTVPLSTVAATSSSSVSSPTSASSSASPDGKNNQNSTSSSSSGEQQKFDAIPKLLFMIENDSGEGFARRVKPLAAAVCKQYEEVKKSITETIAPKFDENAKNLKEQMEKIAVAFSDAHELKFTREELELANRKNEGLQNEIDTARQTVMELMGKIAKLNPKAAKELKEQQQQQNSSPSSPSPSPARPSRSTSNEVEMTSCEVQVSFPMLLSNGGDGDEFMKNVPEDELRQKLADVQYLLEEAKNALIEEQKKNNNSNNGTNSSTMARTASDVQKWKDLVEEERKTLAALRSSQLEAEKQLRARYEEEIQRLKQQHTEALSEKDKNWEQRVCDIMRKSLYQKEEAIRARLENSEMEERGMYLVSHHVNAHVGDAKHRVLVAEREMQQAVTQRDESERQMKELEKDKERLTTELAENTRAMMLLQAGSPAPSPTKSPSASRSRFSLS